MSRRRIKNRINPQANKNCKDVIYITTSFPKVDPASGEMKMGSVGYELTKEELRYMPVYQRAHQLMPAPASFYMDPGEYKDLVTPSIEVLTEARDGNQTNSDTILRALGILGHTPIEPSIHALSEFADSDHSLAPVAYLALAECSSMYPGTIDITS